MPTKRCRSCLRFGRRKPLDPAPPRLVNTASIERPVFIEINPTEFCGQQLRSYMRGLRAPHLVGVRPVTTQPPTDSTDVTVCSPGVSLLHDVNQTARFWPGGTLVSSKFGLSVVCCGLAQSRSGGARRDRTDDLLLAKQALSQLSYGPVSNLRSGGSPPSRR